MGMGTDILKAVLKKIGDEGAEKAYIDTHTENPAFSLYKKMGFEIEGENQIMYSMVWQSIEE